MQHASSHNRLSKAFVTLLLVALWLGVAGYVVWWQWPVAKKPYVPPENWQHFAPDLAMQSILLNGDETWLAGIGGLVKVSQSNVVERSLSVAGSSSAMELRSLTTGRNGEIWIAHSNGLSRVTTDIESEAVPETEKAGALRALALDGTGQLWAGGENGLFQVAPDGALTVVALPDARAEVSVLLADAHGGLWVGTTQHGVMRWQNGWKNWSVDDGLPHSQVTSLLLHSSGDVWVGVGFYSKGGAARFSQSPSGWHIREILNGETLAGPKVRSVFEDSAGRMWFGHEYNGITVRQHSKTVAIVGKSQGLPDEEVTVIREDAKGGLWIGTLKGALHLKPLAVEQLLSNNSGDNDDP